MRGSIRAKVPGKRYEIRVALGRDPRTGRYRQKSLTVHGSKAEAQRALRSLLTDLEAGSVDSDRVERGAVTFGELLDEWLSFKIAADLSPTTIARYRASIDQHLKPALGAERLDRLITKAFDDLYRTLAMSLSPATILKTHLVARAALDRAVRLAPTITPWDRHHRSFAAESMLDGFDFDLDSVAFATQWDKGWPRGDVGPVFGFRLASAEAVDATFRDLTSAGYVGQQPPYEGLMGARYAVVADPDGNAVGLMSPIDPSRSSIPSPPQE